MTLSTTIDPKTNKPYQSWTETGLNTSVGAAAMYVGGPMGIAIGVYYSLTKQNVKNLAKHPDFNDAGEWLH